MATATAKWLVMGVLGLCVLSFPPTQACGWNSSALSGTVQSPNFPSNYSNNQKCLYVITAPKGYQITVTFSHMDLEPQTGCLFDFVELRDGNQTSPVLDRFCNITVPGPERSFGNQMTILFVSDSSNTRQGFRATFVSAKLQAPYLLLTSSLPGSSLGGNIHRMDAETKSNIIIPIRTLLFRPIAVDFDPVEQVVYWTEVGSIRGIRAASLNGSDVHNVLLSPTAAESVMDGVAVDPQSRLVFYTDAGRKMIGALTIATKAHMTVINSSLDSPRDIVLDTAEGVLFWTDWVGNPRIERANYDGSDRRTLVTGMVLGNGLALDTAKQRLYWVDAGTKRVETSDLDGNGRRALLTVNPHKPHHFFGLAVMGNVLFFTDWLTGGNSNSSLLIRMEIGADNATVFGSTTGRRLNDVHVVQPKLDANSKANGCGDNNGDCEVICIPLPGNSSKCACADGETLGSDGRSCGEGIATTTTTTPTPPPTTTPPPPPPTTTTTTTTTQKVIASSKPPSSTLSVIVSTLDDQPLDTDGNVQVTLTCRPTLAVRVTSYAWSAPCAGETGAKCVFKPRPPEDDGRKVTCTVTSSTGDRGTGEMRLELNYPPQGAPTINGLSKDTLLRQGQSVTLTCSVAGGKPLVSTVLFSCGPHLDTTPDIFGPTEVHSVLTIREVRWEDNLKTCICTARWKNTDWYMMSNTALLRVNGTLTQLQQGGLDNIIPLAAGAAGGGAVALVIVIVIVVLICKRRSRPRYERPKTKRKHQRQEENVYSVLRDARSRPGVIQGQGQGQGQGQAFWVNQVFEEKQRWESEEAEDNDLNSHYESLDGVIQSVSADGYLTPSSKKEAEPMPCHWDKQSSSQSSAYIHPVSNPSHNDYVSALRPGHN